MHRNLNKRSLRQCKKKGLVTKSQTGNSRLLIIIEYRHGSASRPVWLPQDHNEDEESGMLHQSQDSAATYKGTEVGTIVTRRSFPIQKNRFQHRSARHTLPWSPAYIRHVVATERRRYRDGSAECRTRNGGFTPDVYGHVKRMKNESAARMQRYIEGLKNAE